MFFDAGNRLVQSDYLKSAYFLLKTRNEVCTVWTTIVVQNHYEIPVRIRTCEGIDDRTPMQLFGKTQEGNFYAFYVVRSRTERYLSVLDQIQLK